MSRDDIRLAPEVLVEKIEGTLPGLVAAASSPRWEFTP
jgi:hypothetical protein